MHTSAQPRKEYAISEPAPCSQKQLYTAARKGPVGVHLLVPYATLAIEGVIAT
jgi:hypothetical protein